MGFLSGNRSRTRTSNWDENRTLALSYIDSLKLFIGESGTAGLETNPSMQFSEDGPSVAEESLNHLQHAITMGFGGRSTSRQTTHESSGWTVKGRYTQTQWDKARYAIGIKEIGAWRYEYAQRSGFVSVAYRTPKPISSVSLHTDEIVPKAFNTTTVRPWIRYWLAFNESQDWVEIAPANEGVFSRLDGNLIPSVLHVNSGIPNQERNASDGYVDFDVAINQVRLKAVLERPEDATDMTPVLKGYRIQMVMQGGL